MKSIVAFLLMAGAAAAAVDPTGPLPIGSPCVYIRHDEMVARMRAQHGAVLIESGALADGRKLEVYLDPVNSLWWHVIVKRAKTATGWKVMPGSPSCLFADSDQVPVPAP